MHIIACMTTLFIVHQRGLMYVFCEYTIHAASQNTHLTWGHNGNLIGRVHAESTIRYSMTGYKSCDYRRAYTRATHESCVT